MGKMSYLGLSALLLVATLSLQTTPAFAKQDGLVHTPTVRFNFNQGHNFDGIGANVWTSRYNSAGVDTLLGDINARYVRVSMLPAIPDDQLTGHMSVEQIQNVIKAYDTQTQRSNFTTFRDRMAKLGIQTHLIVWGMPTPWVTIINRPVGQHPVSTYAQAEHIPDYANYVVAQLLYLRDLGITPAAVELTNEPQGAWSTKFTPAEYVTYLNTARAVMDAYGLTTIKIDGAGTDIASTDFADAMQPGNGAGYRTQHVYDELVDLVADTTSILDPEGIRPTLITEFGNKDYNEDDIRELDINTFEYGLIAAAKSLVLLNKGASSIFYWEASDMPFTKKPHGMLDLAGARRPVANALKTLFSLVPQNSLTALSKNVPATMPMQAFSAGGNIYVLITNTADTPQTFTSLFKGVTLPTSIAGVYAYQDTDNQAQAFSNSNLQNGLLSGTVAAKTLVTLVLR